MSHAPEPLRDRGQSLEDEFFRPEDQSMVEQLRRLKAVDTARDALAKASGVTSRAVIDKLMELGIRAETVAALSLVPLVEVAWADGVLDPPERRAVLERVGAAGFVSGSIEHAMIEAWLDRQPPPQLLTAWTHLVQGMCEQLDSEGRARLKRALLDRARAVAKTSGGVLGFGERVSGVEAAVLARLEAPFTSTA